MPNFPTDKDKKRIHWSVWRGNTWLGEWYGAPVVGRKIKPKECLLAKKILRIDETTGRLYV